MPKISINFPIVGQQNKLSKTYILQKATIIHIYPFFGLVKYLAKGVSFLAIKLHTMTWDNYRLK